MMITILDVVAAAEPAISQDALGTLALHAAAIAGFIRLAVSLLRSPLLGIVWGRVPPAVRPLVLLLLGALAAAFDSIALGTPVLEALFSALGGVGAAISSHEVQERVTKRKKPAAPSP